MALINFDVRHIRAFAAVASELNFVRAAERLHTSQPALSQTIRQLEDVLDVRLFERDTRHVRLTDAGTVLLREALAILDHLEIFVSQAQSYAKGKSGTLKVGYLIGAAVDLMPQILRAFSAQFPEVVVLVKEYDFSMPEAGITEGMDVSILRPPIHAPDVTFHLLLEEVRVACLPSNHRHALAKSISIKDLLEEPIVAAPGRGIWRDYWLAAEYRTGGAAPVAHEAATFEAELQAVGAGRGISIMPAVAPRFYTRPGLTFPEIYDLPPCQVAVALPPLASVMARNFAGVAQSVCQTKGRP